ncbi:Cytosolic carboxypeptidase 6 [Varanus komodoensis]|nr:Cytosolic carboxypeptidase 6 [Varanus komodoensis]
MQGTSQREHSTLVDKEGRCLDSLVKKDYVASSLDMRASNYKAFMSGSDIGIDEIITGNLSKYAAIPPGYLAQPKKGHLVFDACFESGNLGRVDYITEFEYDLFIRPDTCNPRFRVWFNFTVENVKESQVESLE